MLTYKAMYKFVDRGVHAQVLDFPGAISCGNDLDHAREMLAGAWRDMAETASIAGESLPKPDPGITDPDADLEEPIHLLIDAATRVSIKPLRASA